jgi:PilX N-terminal
MRYLTTGPHRERGSVTVIALMILVVLTLIGIMASRTSTTDIKIAANEIPYKQNFFLAEGGLNREAAEVGQGDYAVTQININGQLADQTGQSNGDPLPGPAHVVAGAAYNFTLDYLGYFLPPPGYSVIHFSRYDYDISATGGRVNVASRFYKIGPKAE